MAIKLTMFVIAIPGLPKLRYVENTRYSFQIIAFLKKYTVFSVRYNYNYANDDKKVPKMNS